MALTATQRNILQQVADNIEVPPIDLFDPNLDDGDVAPGIRLSWR